MRNKKVLEFEAVPKDPELEYKPAERFAKLMSGVSNKDDVVLPTDDVIIYIRKKKENENNKKEENILER